MLKKLFLLLIIVAFFAAWLGRIFSVNFSPFSISISKLEKDFLKKAAAKAKSIIYREAAEHNPSGDILPDQIDDKVLNGIKNKVN